MLCWAFVYSCSNISVNLLLSILIKIDDIFLWVLYSDVLFTVGILLLIPSTWLTLTKMHPLTKVNVENVYLESDSICFFSTVSLHVDALTEGGGDVSVHFPVKYSYKGYSVTVLCNPVSNFCVFMTVYCACQSLFYVQFILPFVFINRKCFYHTERHQLFSDYMSSS